MVWRGFCLPIKREVPTTVSRKTDISIQQLQGTVDKWVKRFGVRYFSELTNLAVLMEEVGELARIMSRVYGDQSFKRSPGNADLADELADVLFVLVCIANQTGIDLTAAIERNLAKKTERDTDRHWNNPKLG
jgi:NTP pyrophosphatase (non-canonical NTP hydrolase)